MEKYITYIGTNDKSDVDIGLDKVLYFSETISKMIVTLQLLTDAKSRLDLTIKMYKFINKLLPKIYTEMHLENTNKSYNGAEKFILTVFKKIIEIEKDLHVGNFNQRFPTENASILKLFNKTKQFLTPIIIAIPKNKHYEPYLIICLAYISKNNK